MEAISKLEPHRTMHLQGVDRYGAAAALHSTSADGFKVSGVFRDSADFAILVLYDRDDFFGHPRFSYLPDFDFSGVVLTFDVHYSGLQTIQSPKWASLDWRTLNGRRTDGSLIGPDPEHPGIDLRDHMTLQSGDHLKASADFTVKTNGATSGDKIVLWYQNATFEAEYKPPTGPPPTRLSVDFTIYPDSDPNAKHRIVVQSQSYEVMQGSSAPDAIAATLAAQINGAPDAYVEAASAGSVVTLTLRPTTAIAECSATGNGDPVWLERVGSGESATFTFWWQSDVNYVHSIWFNKPLGQKYELAQGGRTAAQVAADLAALVNADATCAATATADGNAVTLTLKAGQTSIPVETSDSNQGLVIWRPEPAGSPAKDLADRINGTNWEFYGIVVPLEAESNGDVLTVRSALPGPDGNMIRLYALCTAPNRLWIDPIAQNLKGGVDDATWRVNIDFSALGITEVQKLWLTFAPALANGAAYEATEWEATFTNWSVSGENRALKVAGPGSVRLEETDAWVSYSGFWERAPEAKGFFSQGSAQRAAQAGAKVTVETHCGEAHDILVGTRLDGDCGKVEARLDGGAPVLLDCYEPPERARVVRRLLFANVPAGQHSVEIRLTGEKNDNSQGWFFYFDFLECAVRTDVPDAPEMASDVGVATDYDTDHTYKLSPQRLVWAIRKLGLVGPIDHYAGVFWWKQSVATDAQFGRIVVTYGGTWTAGEEAWLLFDGLPLGKSVFAQDTPETIAGHFAALINESMAGIWAKAEGAVLTITSRSPVWTFKFEERHTTANGTVSVDDTKGLESGTLATWTIDAGPTPVLNRAFRDWHADFFRELAAAGMTATVSFSQELVHAPDDPANGQVWYQRFWDDTPVQTATGFGGLYSSHCAFSQPVCDYLKQAYEEVAALMEGSGLAARLQFGEVLWWYFANDSGMAFYDADTKAAFQAAHGRPLQRFLTPADDATVNGSVDADFLRARLQSHVEAIRAYVLASHPGAKFELLWPLDVNAPETKPLLWYVNLPPAWKRKEGSGFETFLIEGFQFGGIDRNLDKVTRCTLYPVAELEWPRDSCGYLMGLFNAGWPWEREFLAGKRARLAVLKIWAYDHVCLFGRCVPQPREARRALVISK